MKTRRHVRNTAQGICAAAFVCAAAGASAQTVSVSALDVASALARGSAISSRSAAVIDASEAARRLGQARLEREQGTQALPGEQAQGANAGAVNHRYWQRQDKLRRMVEQALQRSNETHPSKRMRRSPHNDQRQRTKAIAQDASVSHQGMGFATDLANRQ
jgi:hypothetical protein